MEKLSSFASRLEEYYENPMTIITKYIEEFGLEGEALDIIPKIAKNQLEKIQKQLSLAREWIPVKPNILKCNPGIEESFAETLEWLTNLYFLGLPIPEDKLPEIKAIIEARKLPRIIYKPMLKWLEEKYGFCLNR